MQKLKTIATVLLIPAYSAISIASPAIGVATGFQDLVVNKTHVRGNATLFDGNTFATGTDGARMSLEGGTSVRLGSLSKGTVYHDRLEMLNGSGEIRVTGKYAIDALSLHVRSTTNGAIARVLVSGNHLKVGALSGSLQVLNSKGLLLATVAEGSATEFTPVAEGAAAAPAANGAASSASGASTSGASGASAAGASAGTASTAGAAAASGGIVASHMALIVAGVVVAGAGLATGVTVAATSGSDATLSPSAR